MDISATLIPNSEELQTIVKVTNRGDASAYDLGIKLNLPRRQLSLNLNDAGAGQTIESVKSHPPFHLLDELLPGRYPIRITTEYKDSDHRLYRVPSYAILNVGNSTPPEVPLNVILRVPERENPDKATLRMRYNGSGEIDTDLNCHTARILLCDRRTNFVYFKPGSYWEIDLDLSLYTPPPSQLSFPLLIFVEYEVEGYHNTLVIPYDITVDPSPSIKTKVVKWWTPMNAMVILVIAALLLSLIKQKSR